MKLYCEDKQIIRLSQYRDPLMDHLSSKVISHLLHTGGKALLDIGCGIGRDAILAAKKGLDVVGIDIEEKAIVIAKENAKNHGFGSRCNFLSGDITKLYKEKELKGKKFDVVVCSEVIEHVPNPNLIIQAAYSLLKKDGIFILTTPHDPKLWSVLDEYAEHVRRFNTDEVGKLLARFSIIKLYTVGFPFMRGIFMLYNFLSKAQNKPHSSTWREQTILSNLYYYLMRTLLKIDDLFNRFRIGTNIVVVAKKK